MNGESGGLLLNDRRALGSAVLLFFALVALACAFWRVDDHFITRREFNAAMQAVDANFRAINQRLRIPHHPVPHTSGGGEDQDVPASGGP